MAEQVAVTTADGAPRRRGRPGYDLEAVLRVAVEVFNERGYDGASMEDLSKRLGIAKSGIYHHVSGKEELLRLALDRALDGLWEAAERARALDAPAIVRLETLVRDAVAVLARGCRTSPCCCASGAIPLSSGRRWPGGGRSTPWSRAWSRRPSGTATSGRTSTRSSPRGCCSGRSTRSSSGTGRSTTSAAALADGVCAIAFDGLRVRK